MPCSGGRMAHKRRKMREETVSLTLREKRFWGVSKGFRG
jgi:hypothetical protein